MAGVESRSEYEGGGVMPNTVFPKGSDALTPADKLRLGYITGQETDSRATPDPGAFHGNEFYDPAYVVPPDPDRVARERHNRQVEAARYKETPRPRPR